VCKAVTDILEGNLFVRSGRVAVASLETSSTKPKVSLLTLAQDERSINM